MGRDKNYCKTAEKRKKKELVGGKIKVPRREKKFSRERMRRRWDG